MTNNRTRKIRQPFIEPVALLLVPLLVFGHSASILAEVSYRTAAIVHPSLSLPPRQRAIWQDSVSRVRANPRILLKDDQAVRATLDQWASDAAGEKADRLAEEMALRAEIRSRIDRAWDLYYGFDFSGSRRILDQTASTLDGLPSTDRQARLQFEVLVLDGMARRAQGDGRYRKSLRSAAALDPGAVLEAERYSPDIIEEFREASRKVLSGPRSTLSVTALPEGGVVMIDGRRVGEAPLSGYEILPGVHFVEVVRPGHTAPPRRVELENWGSATLDFSLSPTGPSESPDLYFADRLQSGDREVFRALTRRLGVDLAVVPVWDGRDLKAWLVNNEGDPVSGVSLWSGDTGTGDPAGLMTMLLGPEDEWVRDEPVMGVSVNMPDVPEFGSDPDEDLGKSRTQRWYLILGGALLVALAAGALQDGGAGGTKVDVSW